MMQEDCLEKLNAFFYVNITKVSKICFVTIMFVFTALNCRAQLDWKFSSKKIGDKTYEVHLKAIVDNPWHIYSQQTPVGGPLPTKISFNKNPLLLLSGKVSEKGDLQMKHEDVFDVDVKYYNDMVEFVQLVSLKANVKTTLSGFIEFMVCNDHECMPPKTIDFNVSLK